MRERTYDFQCAVCQHFTSCDGKAVLEHCESFRSIQEIEIEKEENERRKNYVD